MSEEGNKWVCSCCTYENWPKAIKCTICQTGRPSQVICEAALGEERDIYKIAPLITECSKEKRKSPEEPDSLESSSSSAFRIPPNKWACPVCTYLNWPKSTKCTQCLNPTKLRNSSLTKDNKPDSNLSGQTSPKSPRSFDNTEITRSCASPARNPPLQNQQLEMGHSEIGTSSVSDNNDRNKTWSRSLKWCCLACTYENWPKSQKCVICHSIRPRDSQPGSPVLSENEENKRRPITPHSDNGNLRLSPPGRISPCNNNNNNINSGNNSPVGGGSHAGGIRRVPSNRSLDRADIQVTNSLPGVSTPAIANNYLEERRLRHMRRKAREAADWLWLNACLAAVEGNPQPIIQYLSSGGDPARQLTAGEAALLARPSAFDVGHTLVHLAIRFQREDLLSILLSNTSVSRPVAKRVPSDISRDVAAQITRHLGASLRQRKGDFPCFFFTEFVTFALPAEIEDFPPPIQERLFDELLDRDVQKELEEESPIINWSMELTERLGSRLYALWNRSAGDCLLDSVLQATWGVFDRDNTLRRALGDSLSEAAAMLYPRWKEAETLQANLLHFSLDESQWQEDWAVLLSLAMQPGSALEQMHIFTLAHILRRPIIVYGVKYVKSFRGEALGYARFEGIYLPLLWEPNFCWTSPIALGYTRGHFSSLMAMEPNSGDPLEAGVNIRTNDDLQVVFLPLMTSDRQLLPLHFLTQSELGREEEIIRQWLDCCVTEGGILVAQQKIPKRPVLVSQMLEEWLDVYRSLVHHQASRPISSLSSYPIQQQASVVVPSSTSVVDSPTQGYSSDGDSDQE